MKLTVVRLAFSLLVCAALFTTGCGGDEIEVPETVAPTAPAPTGPEPVLPEEGP